MKNPILTGQSTYFCLQYFYMQMAIEHRMFEIVEEKNGRKFMIWQSKSDGSICTLLIPVGSYGGLIPQGPGPVLWTMGQVVFEWLIFFMFSDQSNTLLHF